MANLAETRPNAVAPGTLRRRLALAACALLLVSGAFLGRTSIEAAFGARGSAVRPALRSRFVRPAPLPVIAPQVFEPLTAQQAQKDNSAVPISSLPNPAASPFRLPDVSAADRARAVTCLAMAAYYEAANQGTDGQAAVAQVVLNRLRNPLFPKSVCGVVFQGAQLPTGCQFTFTCDGSLARKPSADGWRQATFVAERALDGYVDSAVGEATHYHTVWVVPYWRPTVVKVAQLGAHIFYRWGGAMGSPLAFRGQYGGAEGAAPLPLGFDAFALIAPPPKVVTRPAPEVAAEAAPAPVVVLAQAAKAGAPAAAPAALDASVPPLAGSVDSYFSRAPPPRPRLPM